MYLHAGQPAAAIRSRRYVALQLEYYAKLFESDVTRQFMQDSLVPWEYARQSVQRWRGMGGRLVNTTYVRSRSRVAHTAAGIAASVFGLDASKTSSEQSLRFAFNVQTGLTIIPPTTLRLCLWVFHWLVRCRCATTRA